jgi:hypothetical protein
MCCVGCAEQTIHVKPKSKMHYRTDHEAPKGG